MSLGLISNGCYQDPALVLGVSLGVLLDNSMRVQPHMFPAGIVMDVISTLADPSGINGWGKAGLGLDGAIDHRLGLLGRAKSQGVGHTAMARGVPLEAEPGHEYQSRSVR